ncbi:hypothetical protein K438DRAFT_2104548 [Mycena galopus ATCC 62051]|nr:hypothetical protein K438DRAFT_2104548 [Mycena galopus ATCC 62051]
MFSKLIVFGLAALTFARAVPAAGPLVSTCNPIGSTAALTGHLSPPAYKIVNAASGATLINVRTDDPAFVSNDDPLKYGDWYFEGLEDHIYKITNKLTGAPLYVDDEGILRCGYAKPFVSFFISDPNGNGVSQISSADRNQFLTVKNPYKGDTVVNFAPLQYAPNQLWKISAA